MMHLPLTCQPSLPALPSSCTSSSSVVGQPILITSSTLGTSTPIPKVVVHTIACIYIICPRILSVIYTDLYARLICTPILYCFQFLMAGHTFLVISTTNDSPFSKCYCHGCYIFYKICVDNDPLMLYKINQFIR